MYFLFQRLIYDFQGNIGAFEPKHLLKVDTFVENDSRDLTSFVAKKVVFVGFFQKVGKLQNLAEIGFLE